MVYFKWIYLKKKQKQTNIKNLRITAFAVIFWGFQAFTLYTAE